MEVFAENFQKVLELGNIREGWKGSRTAMIPKTSI